MDVKENKNLGKFKENKSNLILFDY